ncbi:MAG: sigma-70 family RNA polymerase sigma factor [Acidobacteriota bacterium]
MAANDEITAMLRAWGSGEEHALDRLFPVVYDELRRLSRHYLRRERAGHTLQTTALVHEAYLRLSKSGKLNLNDRAHFYAISARIMRQILVDFARLKKYKKRGGQAIVVELNEAVVTGGDLNEDFIGLDLALNELAKIDSRKSTVVELKFFGGLTADEIAGVLDVSTETVKRDWRLAKSWLRTNLRPQENGQ